MVDLTTTPRLRKLLLLSGIYFDSHTKVVPRRIHQLVTFIIVGLCCYTTLFIIYDIIRNHKFSPQYASYMIVFTWQIQSCIAMLFFIYWQITGTMKKMGSLIEHTTKKGRRAVRSMIITCIFMMISCMLLTFGVSFMIRVTGRASTFFDINAVNPFFAPELAAISLVGGTYMLGISIIIISIFSTQALFVHAELKQLNDSISNVGQDFAEPSSEFLIQELRSHLNWHLIISERIRTVSGIFEKYGFIMFAISIPLSVFTLYTLIVRLSVSWVDAILTIPEVVLGLMKVVFLLYVPSKIQTEAKRTYSILCSNQKLWLNVDQHVYEIANIFLMHAGQHDLGINIWCMTTIISKPFILTGSSVVLTTLMFLLQSHYHCKPSTDPSANALIPAFNITEPIFE
ncbi:hypothetical protein M3Y97_01146200 [Aphelenchoides bicaudatus]|nr:hypothetical protein M3Y97_01146200 [Aphelenchoides bicaudatus]